MSNTNKLEDNVEEEEEEEEEESDDLQNRYKVKCQASNKDNLFQPRCSEIGILPQLPFGMAIVGRSGSGKTQAMIHMLTSKYLLKDTFDFVYLFTGIKADDKMIKALNLKKENIKNNFTEEDVSVITDKMEKSVEKMGFEKCPSVCLIFDDFLNKPKFMKSPTMIKLATANRHMNCSYILLSQYYKKLSPVIRTNVSYLMFFPSSLAEVEKLAEEQTPPNKSKKEMIELVQYATSEPFSFLGINTKADCDKRLRKGFDKIIYM